MGGVLAAVSWTFEGCGVSALLLPSFLVAFGILRRFRVSADRGLGRVWVILRQRVIRYFIDRVFLVGLDESTERHLSAVETVLKGL